MRHYGLFVSISVTLVEDVLPSDDALSVARRSCHALNMILGPNKGTRRYIVDRFDSLGQLGSASSRLTCLDVIDRVEK